MENSLLSKLANIGIDPAYIFISLFAIMIILMIILMILLAASRKRIKRMEALYEDFMRGRDGESLEHVILERFNEIDSLKKSDVQKTRALNEIIENLNLAYQKINIIKYDAFDEMGGKLSFVLTLLTKENDGFILNAVHSREGCYQYIKEIVKGESFIPLAEEEQQSLQQAIKSDNFMLE